MESVKFTIKEAVKTLEKALAASALALKKKIQSNDISKIMSMARSDISPTV